MMNDFVREELAAQFALHLPSMDSNLPAIDCCEPIAISVPTTSVRTDQGLARPNLSSDSLSLVVHWAKAVSARRFAAALDATSGLFALHAFEPDGRIATATPPTDIVPTAPATRKEPPGAPSNSALRFHVTHCKGETRQWP